MTKEINRRIQEFKLRIEEDREFCLELFGYATVRLMAFKYAYYRINKYLVDDKTYDAEEKSWYVMGRALGILGEDDFTPCIDFDENHPKAKAGIELANQLPEKRIK